MTLAHQRPAARFGLAPRLRDRIGRMPVVGRAAELAAIQASGAAASHAALGSLTPEMRKLRLFATVTGALEGLARQRPLLVAIDDLHWSDAASNELLRCVLIHAGAVPLLVLGTYRWEDAMANPALTRTIEELHRRRLLTTIPVGPLAAADTDLRHGGGRAGRRHLPRELPAAASDQAAVRPGQRVPRQPERPARRGVTRARVSYRPRPSRRGR